MTDLEAIGATIDEMYALISGPARPRDWSRQDNCFLPDAVQVRTWLDDHGRAQKISMSLEEYARNTQPFFDANDFYEVETSRKIDTSAISRTRGAHTKRGDPPTTRPSNGAGSTPFSCSTTRFSAGASST